MRNRKPIKIRDATLEILTVMAKSEHSVHMSDGWDYHYEPFMEAPVFARFAVVKERDTVWASGSIVLCQRID